MSVDLWKWRTTPRMVTKVRVCRARAGLSGGESTEVVARLRVASTFLTQALNGYHSSSETDWFGQEEHNRV